MRFLKDKIKKLLPFLFILVFLLNELLRRRKDSINIVIIADDLGADLLLDSKELKRCFKPF